MEPWPDEAAEAGRVSVSELPFPLLGCSSRFICSVKEETERQYCIVIVEAQSYD